MSELDIEAVRARAKELGVEYHPAMKAETIQSKIDEHLSKANKENSEAPAPAEETEAQKIERELKEALALIPITITSMDPADAQLTSASFSVGNRKLGQITKVIPFGMKWYMPRILVDEIESKMFCRTSMVPAPGGTERVNTQWIKKYAVQYHPMPTKEELEELAKLQLQGNELAK